MTARHGYGEQEGRPEPRPAQQHSPQGQGSTWGSGEPLTPVEPARPAQPQRSQQTRPAAEPKQVKTALGFAIASLVAAICCGWGCAGIPNMLLLLPAWYFAYKADNQFKLHHMPKGGTLKTTWILILISAGLIGLEIIIGIGFCVYGLIFGQ